jgi:peptide/nickel transport system substrate-binding protein
LTGADGAGTVAGSTTAHSEVHVNDLEYHLYEEARSGRMTRQQLLVRGSVLGVSAAAMGSILAACGSSASSPSESSVSSGAIKRGGTIRFGVTVPAQDVDPITLYNEGAIATANLALEYLLYPNPDYTLDKRLATGVTPSSDAKSWDFTIRQGVQWHDGSPFTVDDVVATFDRLTDPKSGSAALSAFTGVLSHGNIERKDDQTVTFHLDRAYADFPYLVSAFTYNTMILPKNYVNGSFTKGGIGTGAFILKSYVDGQQATYVRNPHYWAKGMPYADGVVLKYFSDNPPQVAAIQGGAIDAMVETPYQGSQALFSDPNIVILENPSSQYRTLQMRVDQAPFSSKQLRQAVAYAINRPDLLQGLFGGKAVLGNDHAFAPIYPDSPTTAEVPQRVQDIDKAKALVQQATGGSSVNVTLTAEEYLEIGDYANFVKQQLAPAGINVALQVEPQKIYYGTGSNQPWLLVPFGITDWAARGVPGQTIDPAYLCSSVPDKALTKPSAWNSAHWCNPQFDSAVKQFEATVDQGQRRSLAVTAAKIQQDEVPDVIAYWISELRATRKNVHGLAKGPISELDARGVWLS